MEYPSVLWHPSSLPCLGIFDHVHENPATCTPFPDITHPLSFASALQARAIHMSKDTNRALLSKVSTLPAGSAAQDALSCVHSAGIQASTEMHVRDILARCSITGTELHVKA